MEKGRIFIGERLINDVPSHLRGAIIVFQDYALFPHMSIRENTVHGLKIKRFPAQEIEQQVALAGTVRNSIFEGSHLRLPASRIHLILKAGSMVEKNGQEQE